MVRLKIPNLLRLYLNPWVTQTCLSLNEMVHSLWPAAEVRGQYLSFLANSGEEALSGAIKLARYTLNKRRDDAASTESTTPSLPARVVLLDDDDQFSGFGSVTVCGATCPSGEMSQATVQFIPEMRSMKSAEFLRLTEAQPFNAEILVIAAPLLHSDRIEFQRAVLEFQKQDGHFLIACVEADSSASLLLRNRTASGKNITPNIVVFDESFTNRQVPFGAFAARANIHSQWTCKGMATFHSTTYQPNSISTMHFMKCLEERSPQFFQQLRPRLEAILLNRHLLKQQFRSLYNPALTRLISAAEFDSEDVTASGHYVRVGPRRYFDGIGGVACSLRGHNPESWVSEMQETLSARECRDEVSARLEELTELRHHVPAVSGGSAVEHALKLALIAQFPKKYVVALTGGFGGKTLLALTGTAKDSYKKGIDPLYQNVVYVDPFADDATSRLSELLNRYPVAVIQVELIQGVGGVREIPASLLRFLQTVRQQTDVLLFVDEIQTGMFRTGPFVRSKALSVSPDLLTIGKGTSDMMFPFALTMYSDRVHELLQQKASPLPQQLCQRYRFEVGYRAILNTLRHNETEHFAEQVSRTADNFSETLRRDLREVPLVREVRVFGLLIGIELDLRNTLPQRLGLNAAQLYLLQMMKHSQFPLLMGFCQYEPNILKLTPPLTVTSEEISDISRTVADVLRTPQIQLLATGVKALWRSWN